MFAAPPSARLPLAAAVALCMAADALCGGGADSIAPEAAAVTLVAQARALEHGEGVAKDQLQAAALYCEAGREGDAEAQYSLGWMYANGRGVGRDDAVAASLFALASRSGHEYAQRALSFMGPDRGPLPACMTPPVPEELPQLADFDVKFEEYDPFASMPTWKRKIADVVVKLAPAYSVNPRLALAFVAVESNFEPTARSVKDARGLMQLVPDTVTRFNVRDAYAIHDNVRGGLAYLRWLLSYYRGRVSLAAAAYNAGEGVVDRYKGVPPYAETRDYVRRIKELYRDEQHPYDPRIADPSPIVAAPPDKPGS